MSPQMMTPQMENLQGSQVKNRQIEEATTQPLPAPFPHRLQKDKQETPSQQFLEFFKQVKINLPLLEMIKHVPSYAKFIKDLCTFKKRTSVRKGTFLSSKVSAIIRNELSPKFKDPSTPTISCIIGEKKINNALLDLGLSVNLLPFTVYQQLGLGELKSMRMTLQLADRSVKYPRGVLEDVFVRIDTFVFPVDYVVLDTEPVRNVSSQIFIIFGRPFLATIDATIKVRSGVMTLVFGNMTLNFKIFSNPIPEEFEEEEETNCIEVVTE